MLMNLVLNTDLSMEMGRYCYKSNGRKTRASAQTHQAREISYLTEQNLREPWEPPSLWPDNKLCLFPINSLNKNF
jgi:hypothetical protein